MTMAIYTGKITIEDEDEYGLDELLDPTLLATLQPLSKEYIRFYIPIEVTANVITGNDGLDFDGTGMPIIKGVKDPQELPANLRDLRLRADDYPVDISYEIKTRSVS